MSSQSPKAIAKTLNREGIRGPHGVAWSPSTIYDNWKRGTRTLNNDLYIGRLVWNRQKFLKDPDTGKRIARLNPPSEWITADVPELRIIDDEVWRAVKARQAATRKAITTGIVRARRPKYLFSGLTRCVEHAAEDSPSHPGTRCDASMPPAAGRARTLGQLHGRK